MDQWLHVFLQGQCLLQVNIIYEIRYCIIKILAATSLTYCSDKTRPFGLFIYTTASNSTNNSRFNDRAFAVDVTNPPFPRSTAYWWFGCKSAPSGTVGTSESRGWLVGEESSSRSPWDDMVNDMETGRNSANKNFETV